MKKILITGGTGSIGLTLALCADEFDIVIFSRNEKDQVIMRHKYPRFTYTIGDVRDYSEVFKACADVDYVFHLAALKHVDICEKQSQEAIKTNLLGTMNVINACREHNCKLINMSSDKAVNPANVYGFTKSLSETMVLQVGYINIRSGNVLWSAGSVLPIWKNQLETVNKIQLTSRDMTRFFIHPRELTAFMLSCRDNETGTYTAPMVSFRLYDIAEEFIRRHGNEDSQIVITGLRPGERLHEFRDADTSSEQNVCTNLSYIFQ